MTAILMSIQPKYVAKILNKEKLIEIRKRFPKDYRGWVYIYCTKALPHLSKTYVGDYEVYDDTQWDKEWLDLNGKVVARFYCDNVEEIYNYGDLLFGTNSLKSNELLKQSCLTKEELNNYLNGRTGYGVHISQLEIFDKPKELSDFYKASCEKCPIKNSKACFDHCGEDICKITKAPQSWQYVEVGE